MYVRMTFRAVDVYEMLEPLLRDYRKLRYRNMGMKRIALVIRMVHFRIQAAIH